MIYCAKFQVSNLNFIFFTTHLCGDFKRLGENLGSVALILSEKRLDMTDRRADRRTNMTKSIFLVALFKNILVVKKVLRHFHKLVFASA